MEHPLEGTKLPKGFRDFFPSPGINQKKEEVGALGGSSPCHNILDYPGRLLCRGFPSHKHHNGIVFQADSWTITSRFSVRIHTASCSNSKPLLQFKNQRHRIPYSQQIPHRPYLNTLYRYIPCARPGKVPAYMVSREFWIIWQAHPGG